MSSSEIFITKRDGKRERFSIDKIRAAIAKAFYIARSGRPGPVVVDITKDAQCATAPFRYERITSIRSYAPTLTPDARRIEEAARLIDEARRPLAMIGQGAILGNAEAELRAFLDRSGMPAASTLLGLSALPSDDPRNVGMLGMHGNYGPNIKNKECDLLVAVGMRFDDRVTGDPAAFGPNARIIHLEIDPSEIDKIVHADVPLVGDVKRTLPLLTERIRPRDHSAWIEEFRACDRIEYERVVRRAIRPDGGRIRMGEAVDAVARAAGLDIFARLRRFVMAGFTGCLVVFSVPPVVEHDPSPGVFEQEAGRRFPNRVMSIAYDRHHGHQTAKNGDKDMTSWHDKHSLS